MARTTWGRAGAPSPFVYSNGRSGVCSSRLVEIATQPPMVRATGQRSAWNPSTRSMVARCSWSAANR